MRGSVMDYTPEQEATYKRLFTGADENEWFDEDIARQMAAFIDDPYRLGPLFTIAKRIGVDTFLLKDAWKRAQYTNGTTPHPPAPQVSVDLDRAPALPKEAQLSPDMAAGAAQWLEAYCVHSRYWAPRAAAGFHQAIGLWMLSTVAARRICVHLGKPEFPMLFLALVAPSTLYTKSTAAQLARRGLRQAQCDFLLT